MKKEFKRAISKILAGTMLITSSFTGVITVNAATPIKIFEEDFESYKVDTVITSESAVSGSAVNKIYTDTDYVGSKIATSPQDTAHNSSKTLQTAEDSTAKVKYTYLNVADYAKNTIKDNFDVEEISRKYEVEGKIMAPQKAMGKSDRKWIALYNTDGKEIVRFGNRAKYTDTNRVPDGAERYKDIDGVAVGAYPDGTVMPARQLMTVGLNGTTLKLKEGKETYYKGDKSSVESDFGMVYNIWYDYKFTVDPVNKTVDFQMKKCGDREYKTLVTYNDSALSFPDNMKLGKIGFGANYESAGNSPLDTYHDDISVSMYPDPKAAFTYDKNGFKFVAADGKLTEATGSTTDSAITSFDEEEQLINVEAVSTDSAVSAGAIAAMLETLDEVESATPDIIGDGVSGSVKVVTVEGAELTFNVKVTVKKSDPVTTSSGISFEYKTDEISIVASKGVLDISGTDVKDFNKETNTVTLASTSKITAYELMAAMNKVEGIEDSVKVEGNVITVTTAEGKVSFTVVEAGSGSEATTAATTEVTTEVTTAATTEVTTAATTEVTTAATTEVTTVATTEVTTVATTEVTTVATTEVTTAATTEVTTEATTSSQGGSDSKNYDLSGVESAESAADDQAAYASSSEFAVTSGATATKTAEGAINVAGSGKLFTKFPKTYTKGVVSFEANVKLSAGYGDTTKSTGIFELWGVAGGATKDLIAVKANNGKFQLKNNVGGTNVDTNVDVKTDGFVKLKVEVDLDNNVASIYVDGVKIATDEGAVSLAAGIDTIESIGSAAFFVKEANSASQEVSSISVASTESETPTVTGAAVTVEKVALGGANINALKKGDKIQVTYRLTESLKGINNYTFYIDFNPNVLQLDKPVEVAEADAVTYVSTLLGKMKLVPEELITRQMGVVPTANDTDYANNGADGVKTAAQLGRIKLAGVAGLSGIEDANNVTSCATDKGGILFTLEFTVVGEGKASVAMNPVGGAGEKEVFYQTPVSGEGSKPIEIDADSKLEEDVPVNETNAKAPNFVYNTEALKINIANGVVSVDGTAVKDYFSGLITLSKDGGLTVADAIVAIKAGTYEGVTVTGDDKSITITDTTDSNKTITFEFAMEKGEVVDPPVVGGDVTVAIKDAVTLNVSVSDTGVVVTTATGKGPIKETTEGIIAPVITAVLDTDPSNNVNTANLTDADFTVTGADSSSYDASTKTLTLTIGGKEYKLLLYVGGDMNCDGRANVQDALRVVRYDNGNQTVIAAATERDLVASDVNKDGNINVQDALRIVRFDNGHEAVKQFPMFD